MSKNKYENLGIVQLVNQIENEAANIMEHDDDSIKLAAREVTVAAGYIEIRYRTLRIVILMTVALMLVAVGMASYLYDDNAKVKELNDRLIVNANPTEFDSLKDRILLDSMGEIRYQTDETGAPISYMSLLRENTKLKDSLKVSEQLLDMAKRSYGIYFKQNTVGKKTYITIGSKKLEELDENTVESLKKMYPLLDSINKK